MFLVKTGQGKSDHRIRNTFGSVSTHLFNSYAKTHEGMYSIKISTRTIPAYEV